MFIQIKKNLKISLIILTILIIIIGNFLGIGQFKPKGQIITEHELWKKLESRKIKSVRYSKGGTRQMKSFSTYHNVEIQDIDDNFFKTKLYHVDMIYLIKQVPSQKVFHLNVIVLLFDILVPAQVIIFVVYILRQNNLLGGNMSGKTKISASQKSLLLSKMWHETKKKKKNSKN